MLYEHVQMIIYKHILNFFQIRCMWMNNREKLSCQSLNIGSSLELSSVMKNVFCTYWKLALTYFLYFCSFTYFYLHFCHSPISSLVLHYIGIHPLIFTLNQRTAVWQHLAEIGWVKLMEILLVLQGQTKEKAFPSRHTA